MKALYGLIGRKLGHSFSQRFFTEKFRVEEIDARYENFELENIGLLPTIIGENPNLHGFNVTIPYKEQIIGLLDAISEEAHRIGAVNCVKIENGKLFGHNTDAYGFCKSLLGFLGCDEDYKAGAITEKSVNAGSAATAKNLPARCNEIKALVLGTGGASKAVEYVLEELEIDYLKVSRSGGKNPSDKTIGYEQLAANPGIVAERKLIVNTTPLGMYPDTDSAPDIPYEELGTEHYLFDLVYNPETTEFMQRGAKRGARTINGYEMLVGQAERSWEIWQEGR